MPVNQPFELSRCPQSDCPLMQLPAELRLMILRNTLKKSGIIRNAVEYTALGNRGVDRATRKDEYFQHHLQLSAQLLGCCQALYHEAYSVLYDENQLSIGVFAPGRHCEILDVSIELPDIYERWFVDDSSLLEVYETRSSHKLRYNDSKSLLEEPLTVAEKFSHVRLTIHCDEDGYNNVVRGDILTACRSLRHFLLKKHMTIVTLQGNKPGVLLANVRGMLPARKLLSGCRYLRCRSVTFEGFATQDTSELMQLITGDQYVYDVFGMQRALLYSNGGIADQEYLKTLEAAYDINYDRFQSLRRSMGYGEKMQKQRLVQGSTARPEC
ncbi:hypothetical protein LTR70_006534 [Exophiala xenobiotica]|uniref:Uncharacterized protein n=1 Tax=Lithohypha guttulata TaxID=1690604 RepID=A0ABR0K791_9EURO|nr:hypothetical protein LTR24_006025 [Lithohypha guttulata]KAK5315892.1 hypothetical protein LTR70_006534 [Exophiala xenobiotica]